MTATVQIDPRRQSPARVEGQRPVCQSDHRPCPRRNRRARKRHWRGSRDRRRQPARPAGRAASLCGGYPPDRRTRRLSRRCRSNHGRWRPRRGPARNRDRARSPDRAGATPLECSAPAIASSRKRADIGRRRPGRWSDAWRRARPGLSGSGSGWDEADKGCSLATTGSRTQ